MWYETHAENLLLARDMMRLILATTQSNTEGRISGYCRSALGRPNSITYRTHHGIYNDFVLIRFDAANIVVSGPARNAAHVQNCVRGFVEQPGAYTVYPGNQGVFEVARYHRSYMQSVGEWGAKQVYIVGHSYGGAVAQCLAYLHKLDNPGVRCVQQNFGAPKALQERAESFMERGNNWSWVCDRDPVPYLLPSSEESPALHNVLSRAASSLVNQYRWMTGFTIIRDDLEVENGIPPLHGVPASLALVEWFSGVQGFLHPAHTAIHYESQLSQAVDRHSTGVYPGEVWNGSWGDTEPPIETIGSNTQEQEVVGLLDGQVVTPVNPVGAEGDANPAGPAGAGGYEVTVNGVRVGIARTKRHATKMRYRAEGLAKMARGLRTFDAAALSTAMTAQQ